MENRFKKLEKEIFEEFKKKRKIKSEVIEECDYDIIVEKLTSYIDYNVDELPNWVNSDVLVEEIMENYFIVR